VLVYAEGKKKIWTLMRRWAMPIHRRVIPNAIHLKK
jgi:hypothetical protein